MREERRAHRIEVPLLVKYMTYRPAHAAEWRKVTLGQDVSLTGLRFRLAESIPVGTELTVRLGVLGSRQQVTAKGRIMWLKPARVLGDLPYEAGFEFTRVEEKALHLLIRAAYQYWQEVVR